MGNDKAVIVTSFVGYGDLLYLTPFIRFLKNQYGHVEFWGITIEPFIHNPDLAGIKKIDSANVKIPHSYKYKYPFIHMPNPNNNNSIDMYTKLAGNFTLPYKEKYLTLGWSKKIEKNVSNLLEKHSLISVQKDKSNFVMINPVITWKSRTYPLDFYKELIARIQENGDKVVIVGKDIDRRKLSKNRRIVTEDFIKLEAKGLYDSSNFPEVIDLTNKLTLQELGCLYSHTKAAINSENGNMVISVTNDYCWNIYMPTLTSPEFRLPWRKGRQDYKTIVVANDEDYYPTLDYNTMINLKGTVVDLPVKFPTVDKVYKAYKSIA